MSLKLDLGEAGDFLKRWYGPAPRQLVSIVPDGPIAAKCVWPQQPADEHDWLRKAVAGGRNVYFHVNQPAWAHDKRAAKVDIRQVRALHVDIDPRQDETPEDCKARVSKALAEFTPSPSVVIDSGNGLQAFWMLEEEIILDGTPGRGEGGGVQHRHGAAVERRQLPQRRPYHAGARHHERAEQEEGDKGAWFVPARFVRS